MTVSKELLKDLNIISMNILSTVDNKSFFIDDVTINTVSCVLTKYNEGKLFFNLLDTAKIDKEVALQIIIQENEGFFIQENQRIDIIEKGSNYAVAVIASESPTEKTIKCLLERLADLDSAEEKHGRRKEPRVKIGKENYSVFGLSGAEQKIFSKTAKIIQPCAILDVSIHGICIITPFENPAFKNIDNFNIHLGFKSPEQTVILEAHKVFLKLNNTQNKVFATVSCQLLEPINYVWKERVIRMLENEKIS